MAELTIFVPSPVLTVTVENHPSGGDVHLHAGGQGIWQARMLKALGNEVTICCVLTGESGRVIGHILTDAGFRVRAVHRDGLASAYVHDRRTGSRAPVIESPGDPLTRHELDSLYGLMLSEATSGSMVLLSGAMSDESVPTEIYRRLSADLVKIGCTVVADLIGERLEAVVAGGAQVVKLSDDELLANGSLASADAGAVCDYLTTLGRRGVRVGVVTRAEKPAIAMADGAFFRVVPPELEVADSSGAGDSFTAGLASTLANGGSAQEALATAAAAGAVNVTRHGLGTGERDAVDAMLRHVTVSRIESTDTGRIKVIRPSDLASGVHET